MRGRFIAAGIMALFVSSGVLLVKYDEWFKFPPLRGYVNNQTKDSASTLFRNERLTAAGWLCGEMNTKNGYGAYTGFVRFISGSEDDAYVEGMGYVGKVGGASTQRIIDDLDAKIAAIKKFGGILKSGGASAAPSDQEIDDFVVKELFSQRWKKICA